MAPIVIDWDLGPLNVGPLIDVTVVNPRDVIESGLAVGLEFNRPVTVKALLDTGASITVINKVYAEYCKLFLTNPKSDLRPAGGQRVPCCEHAAAISFPKLGLRSIDSIKVLSTTFLQEYYAVLIGRDILRNWQVTFDGPRRRITIVE